MVRPRRAGPLLLLLAGLALAPVAARAAEGGSGNSGSADRPVPGKTAKKRVRKARKKATSKGTESPMAKGPSGSGKVSHAARRKPGHEPATTINDSVEITPFPSHAAAARKALAQNRRDQLDDAEKAARDPHQTDRWQTVLFHLREFDTRADAEACFWRVVAYYRLGEIGRARTIRQSCEIAAKDQPIVEREDALSAGLQPAAALPELAAAGDSVAVPVANPAGYEGASPTRSEP